MSEFDKKEGEFIYSPIVIKQTEEQEINTENENDELKKLNQIMLANNEINNSTQQQSELILEPKSLNEVNLSHINKKVKYEHLMKQNFGEKSNEDNLTKLKDEDVKKKKKSSNNDESKKLFEVGNPDQGSSTDILHTVQSANTEQDFEKDEQFNRCNLESNNKEINKDLIFILRVEHPVENSRSSRYHDRARSRSCGRIRRQSSTGRQRTNRWQVNQTEETEEGEIEDATYELLTDDNITRKMTRTWRFIPKYRLTHLEAAQQEADLYYSFTRERSHEKIVKVGPNEKECCICYENVPTRIIIPCGHQCLCYECAKTIALNTTINRTSGLISKKCPLCRAAIAKMIRPL